MRAKKVDWLDRKSFLDDYSDDETARSGGRMTMQEMVIDSLYEEVMGKIKGAKIFGVPIDIMNIKHLVVASYLFAGMKFVEPIEKRVDESEAECN